MTFRSRVSGAVLGLLALAALLCVPCLGQDTRTVTEPSFPSTSCKVLTARLAAVNGDLPLSAESDTTTDASNIQTAINDCATAGGGAVELAADEVEGYNAFLIKPIYLASNVTLLVDAGVTVFGSRNPADYDVGTNTCGTVDSKGSGCNPLISVSSANNAAIMGYGKINGRGGDDLIVNGSVTTYSWWDLASEAQQQSLSQNVPKLIVLKSSNSFTLYKITLMNAAMFHVSYTGGGATNGLTVWGVKIVTPYTSRNTDGVDPGNITDVTIANSYISDGDDNVAIGASHSPTGNISVINDHFYSGHGMSIGSYTNYGVSNLFVDNVQLAGTAADSNATGIRIKSAYDRGGTMSGIVYQNMCVKDTKTLLTFNPLYSGTTSSGTLIPYFKDITLNNVHFLTDGKVQFLGANATYPLGLKLNNVIFDSLSSGNISSQYANITLGPGQVSSNLTSYLNGTGVTVTNNVSSSTAAYDCSNAFVYLAGELTGNTTTYTTGQPVRLIALIQPVMANSAYPTGTIQILEGSTVVGTATLTGSSDIVNIVLPNIPAGTHTYTALYSGDKNYGALSFGSYALTVTAGSQTATTTQLALSSSNIPYGGTATATATVTGAGGTPTGNVIFFQGNTQLAVVPLSGGRATYAISGLPSGSYTLYAAYVGDSNFSGSSSSAGTVTITPLATTTTLSASASSMNVGDTVTLAIAVSAAYGVPTGTVNILDGSTIIGTSSLSGGLATISLALSTTGSHIITATYPGSTNYATSSSSSTTITVSPAPAVEPSTLPLAMPYTISTVIGGAATNCSANTGTGDGCSGTSMAFTSGDDLRSVVADNFGNVFFTDSSLKRVRKLDAITNLVSTVAGGGTLCSTKTTSEGDGCTAATGTSFSSSPRGIWVDKSDNLYIAGYGDQAIHEIVASTGKMVLMAGTVGSSGAGADGVLATGSLLNQPRGVWTDNNGNIYFADTGNNRVRVVYQAGLIPNVSTPTVGYIYTVAGNPTAKGTAGFAGDGSTANTSSVLLNNPQGGSADVNGNVFIADSSNGRIRVIYMGGTTIANLIAATNGGITPVAGYIYTIAGGGSTSYSGSPLLATLTTVGTPQKIAFDAGNNLYISDSSNNVVWFLDIHSGYIRQVAGGAATVCSGASNTYGDSCPATQASLASGGNGIGVGLDGQGNLYVTDTSHLRIRKVSTDLSGSTATLGGSLANTAWIHFVPGDAQSASTGSNGFAFAKGFSDFTLASTPSCTTAGDSSTDCLVPFQFTPSLPGLRTAPLSVAATTSTNSRTFGLVGIGNGPAGTIDPGTITSIGSGIAPQAIAIDSAQNVYVADANSAIVYRYAPGASSPNSVYSGFTKPTGLALDAGGNLYVADSGAGSVVRIAPDGSKKNVGSGFTAPQSVAVDPQLGNIYVTDPGSAKVYTVSSNLNSQSAIGGTFASPSAIAVGPNSTVYVSDVEANQLYAINSTTSSSATPVFAGTYTAIAIDAAGNIYLADTNNLQVTQLPSQSGASVHAVVSSLTQPAGIALDSSGNLYVADTGASGILKVQRTLGTLSFPDTSFALTAYLSSTGNLAVTPSGSGYAQTDSSDFSLSTDCDFTAPLAVGSVCSFSALFTPTSVGTLTDVVSLSGNYANPPNLTLSGVAGSVLTPTTLAANISPFAPVYGQAIVLSSTIQVNAGTPTGMVTFSVDGTSVATIALDGSTKTVSTTVSGLTVGSHTLLAAYSGDTNFAGSNSGNVSFTVTQAASSISWASKSTTIPYGTTLASILDANGSVAGIVSYTATSASGTSTVTGASVLPTGSYSLTATLVPTDSTDYTSSTATTSLTITQASTSAGLGITTSVVASDGTGNFTSINDGLNSLSSSGGSLYIKPGTYNEALVINTSGVSLYGLGGDPAKVIVTYNNSAGPNEYTNNVKLGDKGSATVQALGSDFYADTLTMQNTFDFEHNQDTVSNAQALALWVSGDRALFNRSRFISRQDTVYGGSKGCTSTICVAARQYFYNSYVEGNVDYIFGDGATVFESSTIHSVYHGTANGEATITAQNKKYTGSGNYLSGEVFSNCTLTAESDNGTMTNLYLGRPWGAYSTSVFLNTNMTAPINSAGWIEFTPGTTNNLPSSYYAEYNSNGIGATVPREAYAIQLNAATAAPWQPITFLAGSDNWNPATSLQAKQAAVVPSTKILTSSVGSSITLIAYIAPAIGGTATGTVTFVDGSTTLASTTLDANGQASLTSSSLAPGTHTITTVYSGDNNFIGSTSDPVTVTIPKLQPVISLASDATAITTTQSATLTATVSAPSSSSYTPSGTVTFLSGTAKLGSAAITNGIATLLIPGSLLPLGSDSITATYPGDDDFLTATSSPVGITVSKSASSTALSVNQTNITTAQPLVLTVTVTGPAGSSLLPTGTVTFTDGSTSLGIATLSGGTATLSLTGSFLGVGSTTISASYGGDGEYFSSTSGTVSISVAKSPAVATLTADQTTITKLQSATVTATVTAPGGSSVVSTGTVIFLEDWKVLGSATLSNGLATIVLSGKTMSLGVHHVTALYSGDSNYLKATSAALNITVIKATPTITLNAQETNIGKADTDLLTITVKTAEDTTVNPMGIVAVFTNKRLLGLVPLFGGAGNLEIRGNQLAVGANSITATYSGDWMFNSVDAPALTITVSPSGCRAGFVANPNGNCLPSGTPQHP